MKHIYLSAALIIGLSACNPGGPTYISTDTLPTPQISVSATGTSVQAPDTASVSAGVVTQGKTAGDAMRANASRMSAVFDALKAAGILEKNIQTSQLSLSPRYNYQDRRAPVIEGYEARNTVSAKTENLEGVGPMLDALVQAGVNNINGVQFSVKDPKAARDEARDKAIKAAKTKAQAMADAAGVTLGDLQTLRENSGGFNPPQAFMARTASLEDASTPIAAGEQSLSVTVNMTYAIEN